jgi:alpha-mannosidase
VLDLNLLRSPGYPDPQADRAHHECTYSLYPHAGNYLAGNVVKAGYELNVPLRVLVGEPNANLTSFAYLDRENVVIEAVKKAEDGDDIILRLYEATGATTHATLTLNVNAGAIWKTNLLEQPEEKLFFAQNVVELALKPFEIVTLRVQVAKAQ